MKLGFFSIVPPYSETTLVSSMWSIGHTSEQPDKAMRVLNEMYTNPELANLLTYGIEGKTYQILDHEQNIVGFPKGIDSDNVPYGFIIWSWPNELIAHVWQKDPPDVWQQVETFNQEAHPSPARGFVWDNTEVLGEVSACNAVLDEYRNALECGSLDPAVTLPRMNQELRAAGIDKNPCREAKTIRPLVGRATFIVESRSTVLQRRHSLDERRRIGPKGHLWIALYTRTHACQKQIFGRLSFLHIFLEWRDAHAGHTSGPELTVTF